LGSRQNVDFPAKSYFARPFPAKTDDLLILGRELLKEGELLKISRKGEVARYFILLNDCILCTSYQVTKQLSVKKYISSFLICINWFTTHAFSEATRREGGTKILYLGCGFFTDLLVKNRSV
jgi:hypothetical protein